MRSAITITSIILFGSFAPTQSVQAESNPKEWRSEHKIIDLHMHISSKPEHLARAVRIMDKAGIGIGVNLSGGTVMRDRSGVSEFKRNWQTAQRHFPGRFIYYMNLDFSGWDHPAFSAQAVAQVEEGARLGAKGLKISKSLGLYHRDSKGKLIRIDDPRLNSMWQRLGELNMPVSIHTADPKAFWLPYNKKNERWQELKGHPDWWFGDAKKFPSRESLLAARNRVITRHPKTTFVCVHFS